MTSEHEFGGSYVIRSRWTRFAVLWSLVVSGGDLPDVRTGAP
ncbi:hypothetical protein ACI1MP_33535 [Kitasatospora griseola]